MTWLPKYSISHKLLLTIRTIGEAIGEIRNTAITEKNLQRLAIEARELSTYASTSIEGNPLPFTDVKHLLKIKKEYIRNTEKEILNYNQALQKLYADVHKNTFKLNIDTLLKTQKQVVHELMNHEDDCGQIRNAGVVIRNPRKQDEIIFIPPDAKDVLQLTQELMEFINKNKGRIDPIILAGLFHQQSVIIHPFMDGNGRTTRLLTTAILGSQGLNLFEIFSFENYYNQNVTRYFEAVGLKGDYYEVADAIEHTQWLEYFADGILDELGRIRKTLPSIQNAHITLDDHHHLILDYINKHGSITQRKCAQISSRSLAARKLDLKKLTELNLLEARGTGRGTYYIIKR